MNADRYHRHDDQVEQPLSSQPNDKAIQASGTPEETHLTVKLMGSDWIIENGVGASVGSAKDRESAIGLAKEAALYHKASGISILAADGSLEENLKI